MADIFCCLSFAVISEINVIYTFFYKQTVYKQLALWRKTLSNFQSSIILQGTGNNKSIEGNFYTVAS